jgi:hypothetical protein
MWEATLSCFLVLVSYICFQLTVLGISAVLVYPVQWAMHYWACWTNMSMSG